jgi:hypothetical protein
MPILPNDVPHKKRNAPLAIINTTNSMFDPKNNNKFIMKITRYLLALFLRNLIRNIIEIPRNINIDIPVIINIIFISLSYYFKKVLSVELVPKSVILSPALAVSQAKAL